MKLNLNFDGNTKLKDWWGIVKSLFFTIEEAFNAEVQAREQADITIGNKLNDEVEARALADTDIYDKLDGEIVARELADAQITDSVATIQQIIGDNAELNTKNTYIVNAINEVAANLSAETEERMSSDTDIKEKIKGMANIIIAPSISPAETEITTKNRIDDTLIVRPVDVQIATPSKDQPQAITGIAQVYINDVEVYINAPMYGNDYFDITNGTLTRSMVCYTFTGDEDIKLNTTNGYFEFIPVISKKKDSKSCVACTHYPFGSDNERAIIANTLSNKLFFKDSDFSTVEEFKAFLKAEKPSILYPTEQVTENIDVSNITVNDGENTVLVYGTATSLRYSVEYGIDTKTYIDKKISELKTAILQTGGNV